MKYERTMFLVGQKRTMKARLQNIEDLYFDVEIRSAAAARREPGKSRRSRVRSLSPKVSDSRRFAALSRKSRSRNIIYIYIYIYIYAYVIRCTCLYVICYKLYLLSIVLSYLPRLGCQGSRRPFLCRLQYHLL